MGGTAFLIRGMLAEHRLEPRPIKRTLMDRIVGRQRFEKPKVIDLGGGRRYMDFPAGGYQILATDFREYLSRRITDPWPATRAVLRYMNDKVMSVHLRGEQAHDRTAPEFYVQLSFSGCAGTAEISAEVASHWAEIYYREEHERLKKDYLYHLGFAPDDSKIQSSHVQFLPVGELGYARYMGENAGETDPSWEGSRQFELDAASVDAFYERGSLSLLRDLDTRFGPVMADGECRCQLCMPGFDHTELDSFRLP